MTPQKQSELKGLTNLQGGTINYPLVDIPTGLGVVPKGQPLRPTRVSGAATHWFHYPGARGLSLSSWPHGTYTHTSIRGFMRAYINYKIRSRQKVEKIEQVEMAETREVRRGFTFLTDFSKNSS